MLLCCGGNQGYFKGFSSAKVATKHLRKISTKAIMDKKRVITVVLFSLLSVLSATFVMVFYTIERAMAMENEVLILSENKTEADCPFWHLTNDGYCDDEANIEQCNYDFGDCCTYENDFSTCQDCFCTTLTIEASQNCDSVVNLWDQMVSPLGDGKCDLNLNNVDYFFDYGDCCLEDPICQIHIDGKSWRGHSITETKQIDCPDNVCIKSDRYCIKDQIGDGICQDHNNSPFCDHDQGDCCLPVRVLDFCCQCTCKECYPGDSGCLWNLGIEDIREEMLNHQIHGK